MMDYERYRQHAEDEFFRGKQRRIDLRNGKYMSATLLYVDSEMLNKLLVEEKFDWGMSLQASMCK